jgi:tetratricopeptide (TPR) repeat protein
MRDGNRLRVETQLVRASDDTTLWSGRFDRELKDLFAIQDEISRSIVNELRLTLGSRGRQYRTDIQNYDAYLRGRALLFGHDVRNARRAAELFEAVTTRDPAFAPAYAGLADAWAIMSANYQGVPARDGLSHIQDAAHRALQLDPLLAEGHAALGMALARDYQWTAAQSEFRRALELNPNLSTARANFAQWTLYPEGRVAEALQELNAALASDPLSTDIAAQTAYVMVSARRYDEVIERSKRLLPMDPTNLHVEQVMARAMFQKGQHAAAIEIFRRQGAGSQGFLGYALARIGRREEALRLAEANANFPAREVLIFAGLGDTDKAIAVLKQIAERKEPRVQYLTYPELSALVSDPRMEDVRKAFGLPRRGSE